MDDQGPQADRTGQSALCVRDLTIGFNGQDVLERVSLDLPIGRRGFLIGPSGCGKTSLLRAMMGLIRPRSGEISVLGQMLNRQSVGSVRTRIGYVPQEPDIGDITARRFLEQPFAYRANHDRKFTSLQLDYWMDFFGLSRSLLDQPCSSLSGGQKQRFAVLLVILLDRRIILLDEPTSAMDAPSRQALRRWITEQRDRTFLIVSHDPELEELAQETIDLGRYCGGTR